MFLLVNMLHTYQTITVRSFEKLFFKLTLTTIVVYTHLI